MLDVEDGTREGCRAPLFDRSGDRRRSGNRTADFLAGAARLFETGTSQGVHTLILRMAVMPPHPVPFNRMTRSQCIEATPQILILDRVFPGSFPTSLLPTVDPLTDAFLDILRIGIDPRFHRPRERLQRLDDRQQLHAVVRRRRLPAAQFRFSRAAAQKSAPAARPGVSAASAIRIDIDHSLRPLTEPFCVGIVLWTLQQNHSESRDCITSLEYNGASTRLTLFSGSHSCVHLCSSAPAVS